MGCCASSSTKDVIKSTGPVAAPVNVKSNPVPKSPAESKIIVKPISEVQVAPTKSNDAEVKNNEESTKI